MREQELRAILALIQADWWKDSTYKLFSVSLILETASMDPFVLAREALRFVGEFGTPPTPKVFETWYRYVDGSDQELVAHMDHSVKEAKSVSVEWIENVHAQFCAAIDPRSNVSQSLGLELESFQSLVSKQKAAGVAFEHSIESAGELLASNTPADENVAACIAELDSGSRKMKQSLDEMASTLDQAHSQVAALQKELVVSQRAMMTDHLTGVGNRRFFETLTRKLISDRASENRKVYLAVIDMDRFKAVNDSFGHEAGDQIIRVIAASIASVMKDASVARLGGDEFAVIMHATSREDAVDFAEQVREYFVGRRFKLEKTQQDVGTISLSMGVALLRNTDDATSWCDRADKLLYNAKQLGRNRAVVEK